MKYKLEDISLKISKGSTPRGKVNYSSDENNLFLRVTDLSELQHIETAEYTLSDDDIKKNKMKIWPSNTVLVSIEGTVGKVAMLKKPMTFNQAIAGIIPDKEKVIPEYLMYYLRQTPTISSILKGTIMPALRLGDLSSIELDLPDLETQKKIVRILSALDQKIELNNQESKNLHKIIKTLYGNTATSIKEKTKLADLAKISSGKRPASIETNGEYVVVGARDVMGFTNEYNQEPEVIITGRVGTLGVIKRYSKKIWASDNTLIVDTRYKNYIECYLSSVDFGTYNRGSTQPLITQTDLKNFVLPFDKEKCDSFENKTASLRNKMFAIERQNERLIMLRDTLLPKLMSGEINLGDIQL